MKFLVCAGGTGGHFYPGLAVARALLSASHAVTFVVGEGDYVLPLLEREKIPFRTLSAAGFRRKLTPSNLVSVVKVIAGMVQAVGLLRDEAPDAVLVMGGYLSFAPALAARLRGVPVVLCEQNAVPGLANRVVALFASRIAVSFEGGEAWFGRKAVLTGNPVRPEFLSLPAREAAVLRWGLDPAKKTVLVFGGSLGAQRLNTLVANAFVKLGITAGHWQVLHFTGPSDVARVKALYAASPVTHHVDGYCHEMPAAYAAADLVVSRSGASTISELIATRKAALLVPYPLATGQHQTRNAELLSKAGAAMLREQRDLVATMGEVLGDLLDDDCRRKMADAYARVGIDPFSAADKIRDLVVSAAYPEK